MLTPETSEIQNCSKESVVLGVGHKDMHLRAPAPLFSYISGTFSGAGESLCSSYFQVPQSQRRQHRPDESLRYAWLCIISPLP